jgi:hypothetical protein
MTNTTVIHICRSRSQAAKSLAGEFEAWKREHAEAMAARDVEDWVAECLTMGHLTLELFSSARKLARANQLASVQEAGECLVRLFEATLDAYRDVGTGVVEAGRQGYTIENEAAFREMEKRLTEGRERLRASWPWINPDSWRRTEEAIARGEFQTAGEILHDLHGGRPSSDPG